MNRVLPARVDSLIDIGMLKAELLPVTTTIIELFRERGLLQRAQKDRLDKALCSLSQIMITDLAGEEMESRVVKHIVEELLSSSVFGNQSVHAVQKP